MAPDRGAPISKVSTHAPRVHEERPTLIAGQHMTAVSTHAPRVHEERLPRLPAQAGRRVSTHAPRVHEERPAAPERCRARGGFNPRSSRSRGATRVGCQVAQAHRVSTHAPRVHEERLDLLGSVKSVQPVSTHAPRVHEERRGQCHPHGVGPGFQPTLLAFTRSDLPQSPPCAHQAFGFNPRSSRSRGATSNGAKKRGRGAVSTHAPRVHEERQRLPSLTTTPAQFQPTLLAFTRSDPRWPCH